MINIFRNIININIKKFYSVVSIGNFDGLHKGHQSIFNYINNISQDLNLVPIIITLYPHPKLYFDKKNIEHKKILNMRDKLIGISNYGVKKLLLSKFDKKLSGLTPIIFIKEFLCYLNVKYILIGNDFRFGYKRLGNIQTLKMASKKLNFFVNIIPNIFDCLNKRISSSEIRHALSIGDVSRANHLIGNPYSISGHIVHGKKVGRIIGYPTINIKLFNNCVVKRGSYMVIVNDLENKNLQAVANIGKKPTVKSKFELIIDIYLLHFNYNVINYGKIINIQFLHYIRKEQKFSNLESLIFAISKDVRKAKLYFSINEL